MSAPQFPAISLPFYKLSPGGNPTVLVPEAALPKGVSRAALARVLMDMDHLGAEQVGFIRPDANPPCMDMMGGEFCVNACRSAALIFARLGRLSVTEKNADGTPAAWAGEIATSGLDRPALVTARAMPDGTFTAAVAVPLAGRAPLDKAAPPAKTFPLEDPAPGICLARLPGIAHLLLDMTLHPLPADWRQTAVDIRLRYAPEGEEAVGVVWHERLEGTEKRRIHPAVWVRDTDSLVMESACGSGSLALALWAARQNGRTAASVRQASGHDLTVRLEPGRAWIDGPVELTAKGTVYCGGFTS